MFNTSPVTLTQEQPAFTIAVRRRLLGILLNGMSTQLFEKPILNSPYEYPRRHWELDSTGQPTQNIAEQRRIAEFITPIPKPKKRKQNKKQSEFVFDEGHGISTEAQQYDPTPIINALRRDVDIWRAIPSPATGKYPRKLVDCFSTGAVTSSTAFVHSFAKSKR